NVRGRHGLERLLDILVVGRTVRAHGHVRQQEEREHEQGKDASTRHSRRLLAHASATAASAPSAKPKPGAGTLPAAPGALRTSGPSSAPSAGSRAALSEARATK